MVSNSGIRRDEHLRRILPPIFTISHLYNDGNGQLSF
jgi:hypothetical protein